MDEEVEVGNDDEDEEDVADEGAVVDGIDEEGGNTAMSRRQGNRVITMSKSSVHSAK